MQPSRSGFRTSRTFDVIFILLLAVGAWQAYAHRIGIDDWIFFRFYSPSPQIVTLANDVGFTPEGRRLFYRGNPEIISDQAQFSATCNQDDLGCLTAKGRIIIYDPTQNPHNEIITAAHETLHLAYRRYSASTRSSINGLMSQALDQYAYNPTLQTELQGDTGNDRLDEAHSYLGTEYAPLPPALESHYAEYFQDRAKIVAVHVANPNE